MGNIHRKRNNSQSEVPSQAYLASRHKSVVSLIVDASQQKRKPSTIEPESNIDPNHSVFDPAERLSKILQQKTKSECGLDGIGSEIFVTYVFPEYPDLGYHIFWKMQKDTFTKRSYLDVKPFREQCEFYLSVLDDLIIYDHYVKMFTIDREIVNAWSNKEQTTPIELSAEDFINKNGLSDLMLICFRIGIVSYVDEKSSKKSASILPDQVCPHIMQTIQTVIQSCFFAKDTLSIAFVSSYLQRNLPHLLVPLHYFCVHKLTTVYKTLTSEAAKARATRALSFQMIPATLASQEKELNDLLKRKSIVPDDTDSIRSGEIVTGNTLSMASDSSGSLMSVSQSWLLAAALPNIYTRLFEMNKTAERMENKRMSLARMPPIDTSLRPVPGFQADVTELTASTPSSTPKPISNFMPSIPNNWTLLYTSREHGVGVNRFLHHVIGYDAPTLVLLQTEMNEVLCLASPTEWRETDSYTGGRDCRVIQLFPRFSILQKGRNLLYLNTSIRGYPKGLRAGTNPKEPLISIDEFFDKITYRGETSDLILIEVYGCGHQQTRKRQIDIKRWQVEETMRLGNVKISTEDWADHPDRFLLKLGRQSQFNEQNV